MLRSLARLAPALLLAPTLAVAQVAAPADSGGAARPGASPAAAFDASRLAPGEWTYTMRQSREGQSSELGSRTLSVAAATEGGRATWRIVDAVEAGGQRLVDTLWVTRDSLVPVRRSARMGPMTFALAFSPDSVRGTIGPEGAQMPVRLAHPAGLMVNSGMLESAFTLLPLEAGWTATVPQLAPSPTGVVIVPVELEVTGEEEVTVPAGTFASWRVEARSGGASQTIWLARADGRFLRMRTVLPQMQGVEMETVLTGGAPLPPGARPAAPSRPAADAATPAATPPPAS